MQGQACNAGHAEPGMQGQTCKAGHAGPGWQGQPNPAQTQSPAQINQAGGEAGGFLRGLRYLVWVPRFSIFFELGCKGPAPRNIGVPLVLLGLALGPGCFFLKTTRPTNLQLFSECHAAGRPASRPWKFLAKVRRASRAKPDQNGPISAETFETESSRAEPDATHALCLSKTSVFTSTYAFLHLLRTHQFLQGILQLCSRNSSPVYVECVFYIFLSNKSV